MPAVIIPPSTPSTDYLTSTSTIAQVNAAYDNNDTYDLEGSTTKARLFVDACRVLLRRMAEQSRTGTTEITKNVTVIEGAMKDALRWLQSNDATMAAQGAQGYIRGADLRSYRS